MSGRLPQGWKRVALARVALFVPTGVPDFDGEVEYYSTGSIQPPNTKPEGCFTFQSRPSRANRWSQEGDVLQARMQGSDKGILISRHLARRLFSTGFLQLRPYPGLCEAGFLAHYVRSLEFLSSRDELATGSTQVALTDGGAKQLSISLAPVAEQRRIVVKLDKLLEQVGFCQQRLTKIAVLLKGFHQSVLDAACSGRLTAEWRERNANAETSDPSLSLQEIGKSRMNAFELELRKARAMGDRRPRRPSNLEPKARENPTGSDLPDSWLWTSIEDVASTAPHAMSSGPFGSSLGRKDYQESGIPVIRSQNIQEGRFVPKEFVFISEQKAQELCRSSARPNDIVVVAVGVGAGEAAVIPRDFEFGILSQNCNKITVDTELAVPAFVNFVFQIQTGLDQLRDRTTDTAREFLSLTNLKTILLPLPPLAEQHEIVRRVDALFEIADALEARYQTAKSHVDRLRQSILAKAFLGELVPQDPKDEAASVLLERIEASSAQSATRKLPSRAQRYKATNRISAMTKSRYDDDVKGKPYLANILRSSTEPLQPDDLFKRSELPVVDFYKQLSWEVDQGHIREDALRLEAA